MQEYDVNKLKRLTGMEQHVTDEAVDEWRKHLQLCVSADGEHFEYKLWHS